MREGRKWGPVMSTLCAMVRIWTFIPKEMGAPEGCERRVAMCMLGSPLWLSGEPLRGLAVPVSSTSGTLWTLASFWDPRIGAMPLASLRCRKESFVLE